MKLHYCKVEIGNFGDDMNAWFWDAVFPEYHDLMPDVTMFGIGSILWKSDIEANDKILVMGSGTGVGVLPKETPGHLKTCWVRGPLTAKELGVDASVAVTDGAALVSTMEEFRNREESAPASKIFVPHVGTASLPVDWERTCKRAGVRYVTPSAESKSVIREIAQAEFVVTESLHGAIIADAFRVPWVPLAISPKFSEFKWQDWARSIELDLTIPRSLEAPKKLYSALKEAKRIATLKPREITAAEDPNTKVRVPQEAFKSAGSTFELQDDEKAGLRNLASKYSGVVERLLARDIRNCLSMRPFLSREGVVDARCDEMLSRIDKLRRGVDLPVW